MWKTPKYNNRFLQNQLFVYQYFIRGFIRRNNATVSRTTYIFATSKCGQYYPQKWSNLIYSRNVTLSLDDITKHTEPVRTSGFIMKACSCFISGEKNYGLHMAHRQYHKVNGNGSVGDNRCF